MFVSDGNRPDVLRWSSRKMRRRNQVCDQARLGLLMADGIESAFSQFCRQIKKFLYLVGKLFNLFCTKFGLNYKNIPVRIFGNPLP